MALYEEQQSTPAERRWSYDGDAVTKSRSSVLNGVYRHMALGLGVTGVTAMMAERSEELTELVGNHFLALAMIQIGVVIGLSALVNRLSGVAAGALFYFYALLTGLTLSLLFRAYTADSIASTFFITAGTFGGMSAYGYITKRDLTGLGHFMIMGLWGLIIASVVNIFMQSPMILWMTTYLGVLIFVGLTAYDTQRIKRMAAGMQGEGDAITKVQIIGALVLYLDFINLFLNLLRIMGRRR